MLPVEKVSEVRAVLDDDSIQVSLMPPPKYLLPFIEDSNIIFLYKQENKEFNSLIVHQNHGECDSDSDELTGQPLECPFSSDDDSILESLKIKPKHEDTQNGLSLNEAIKVVSTVNIEIKPSVPVIILTDGLNESRLVVLGTVKTVDGWCSRLWIDLQDSSGDAARACNVDDMITKHNQLSHIHSAHTNSEVSCRYFIEGVEDNQVTVLQESTGSVEFYITWKTPSFSVPVEKTNVQLTIRSNIGHEGSEISPLWYELILLYDYLVTIKKWKHDKNTQGLYSRHCIDFPNIGKLKGKEQNSKLLYDRLSQLLREPNEAGGTTLAAKMSENERTTLEETVRKMIKEKKADEFTDRVWTLLIECCTYEQVCSCFDKLFQAVKNGICKPYIKSTNVTCLAHLIRCCRNDPDRFSATYEPLELLVEIGIEKLKKDLVGIFLFAKVITAEKLHIPSLPKFPEIPMSDWIYNCSQWILWILRVQISLQLMLLTESTIKFKGCIIPLASSTLKHYLGSQSPIVEFTDPRKITNQTFITTVERTVVQDLFHRKTSFNSWKLKLRSETENRRVESIFYRDMSDTFPSSVSSCVFDNLDVSVNNTYTTSAFPYHCYNCHIISDRLFNNN